MVGVDAERVATEMIDCESFGDRSDADLVGVTMGWSDVSPPDAERSVLPVLGGSPDPTVSRFVYLRPESLVRRNDPSLVNPSRHLRILAR